MDYVFTFNGHVFYGALAREWSHASVTATKVHRESRCPQCSPGEQEHHSKIYILEATIMRARCTTLASLNDCSCKTESTYAACDKRYDHATNVPLSDKYVMRRRRELKMRHHRRMKPMCWTLYFLCLLEVVPPLTWMTCPNGVMKSARVHKKRDRVQGFSSFRRST